MTERETRFAAISILILLAACLNYHATNRVPIKGSVPLEQKLRIAEAVSSRIAAPEVRTQVAKQFNLTEEQAASLFAAPQTLGIQSLDSRDKAPSTTVYVVVGIRQGPSMGDATRIVKFYGEIAEREIAAQLQFVSQPGPPRQQSHR
jgi:hypothetical protein